jgi:hypothetical protein
MSKSLEAWDGIFRKGQINDLINLVKFAKIQGFDLETELIKNPPAPKYQIPDAKTVADGGMIKNVSGYQLSKACENAGCNGEMELYTVCCSDAAMKKQGFLTKWECKKCGKVDYDKRSLTEVKEYYSKIEEVGYGIAQ